MTVAENRIGTIRRRFENRNAASLAGVQLSFVRRPEPLGSNEFHGLFGDTLKVRLHVPPPDSLFAAPDSPFVGWGDTIREILEVTTRCMRENARREARRFKFLEIGIEAGIDYSDMAGIFEVIPLEEKHK